MVTGPNIAQQLLIGTSLTSITNMEGKHEIHQFLHTKSLPRVNQKRFSSPAFADCIHGLIGLKNSNFFCLICVVDVNTLQY